MTKKETLESYLVLQAIRTHHRAWDRDPEMELEILMIGYELIGEKSL